MRRDSLEWAFGSTWFQSLNLSQIVAESRLGGRSPDWEGLPNVWKVIRQIRMSFGTFGRSFPRLGGASEMFGRSFPRLGGPSERLEGHSPDWDGLPKRLEGHSPDWEGLFLQSKIVAQIETGF